MSAYSEWRAGMITDAEYAGSCREEEYTSRYWAEHPDEFDDDEEVFEEDDIEDW